MYSLLFPGQGSQVVGMGLEFYNNFDIVKKIFQEADDKLNFSLSKIILEGPEDQLQLTKNTQPAILTVSYSIFKTLKDEFNFNIKNCKYFAGHSLGEYSALVCSNSLEFSDAVYLLNERGKAMQKSVPLGKGSMIAVLGLSLKELENELIFFKKKVKGICEIANDNATGQIIVSGEKDAVTLFQKSLKEKKIKSIPLKVSAPFHCSLMKPAADIMKNKLSKINFKDPIIPLIYNVTSETIKKNDKIENLLVDQIFSTVKWRETLLNMSKSGIINYIEIGPGKVLTGMVKEQLKTLIAFQLIQLLILRT